MSRWIRSGLELTEKQNAEIIVGFGICLVCSLGPGLHCWSWLARRRMRELSRGAD